MGVQLCATASLMQGEQHTVTTGSVVLFNRVQQWRSVEMITPENTLPGTHTSSPVKSRIDAWMAAEVGREGEDGGVRGGRKGGEREENDRGDKGEGGGGGSGGSGGSGGRGNEPSSSPPPSYDDRMKSNATIRKERRGCGTIIHGSLKSSHLFFQHNHIAELRKRTPTKAAVAIDFSYVKK